MDVVISFVWNWMPSGTALATFVCYTVVAGKPLTVATAFTAIALFSYLQRPMLELPDQVLAMLHGMYGCLTSSYGTWLTLLGTAYVSMQRIEKFLDEPEVPDWASSLKRDPHPTTSNETEIGFDNATFEWDTAPKDGPSRFTLGPLNIKFPPGKLSLVSGPTGSGKSALLVAMLGGMSAMTLLHAGPHVLTDAHHMVCTQKCIAHLATSSSIKQATRSRTAHRILGLSTPLSGTTSSLVLGTGTMKRGTRLSSMHVLWRRTLRSSPLEI